MRITDQLHVRILNTVQWANENPTDLMFGIRGIHPRKDSNKEGQDQVVAADQLPVKIEGCTESDLEDLGFVLGPLDPNDPLFRPATLPEGWTKRPTQDVLRSLIVDPNGFPWFVLYYRAIYYEREAFMILHGSEATHGQEEGTAQEEGDIG